MIPRFSITDRPLLSRLRQLAWNIERVNTASGRCHRLQDIFVLPSADFRLYFIGKMQNKLPDNDNFSIFRSEGMQGLESQSSRYSDHVSLHNWPILFQWPPSFIGHFQNCNSLFSISLILDTVSRIPVTLNKFLNKFWIFEVTIDSKILQSK